MNALNGEEWDGYEEKNKHQRRARKANKRKFPRDRSFVGKQLKETEKTAAKKAVVKTGEYKTDGEVEAPEYESLAGFGSMILNDNIESIVKANELCNDYGIDTISSSSIIALIYS